MMENPGRFLTSLENPYDAPPKESEYAKPESPNALRGFGLFETRRSSYSRKNLNGLNTSTINSVGPRPHEVKSDYRSSLNQKKISETGLNNPPTLPMGLCSCLLDP